MSDFDKHSRVNKFEKRRKNTKHISILMITGSVLMVVLFGMWIFGGGNDDEMVDSDDPSSDNDISDDEHDDEIIIEDDEEENEETEDTENNKSDENNEGREDEEDNNTLEEDIEIEEAEPSDDNVIEAYTGNWQPIGTEQEGPHTMDYDDGSQDRIEIQEAVIGVTGLDENDMTTDWVGNDGVGSDGEQRVVATVSSGDRSEIYRVFLSWRDGEGWQPTKVEELRELDF